MWRTKKDLVKEIRHKQKEMYSLAKSKGVSDPTVYFKSCELDNLIVEYMKKYGCYTIGSLFPNYEG
ncbi:aspartyl-phosphate phosphatase Spo0E family protein [Thermincola potens]|uniref:Sporulation stage 0, Spo0E-like regulatory phosphatase n=1 Tax=Thermincola potens (strain JR) TaxID=635013 RepID=D5XED9_THEPJ|nr:aspartyl-phosphate phosphatase Spo0E family protein [Thermincola potens]ADG82010.1 Sporulation stage 0, Spo0E-like regulatory phosphatase [Thermincola potens JR]